jgi:glycosyltransferase involved in cell wall biosynthesis
LLFLAHRFPPLNTSGSVRAHYIAKYLTLLGWDVTVVTPHASVWRKVDDPQLTAVALDREGIRRIYTDQKLRFLDPEPLNASDDKIRRFAGAGCRGLARRLGIDKGTGWIREAERACSNLSAGDVDLIFATGQPFAAFHLAKRLSDKLNCPYVLDYRDLWTQNPHLHIALRPMRIRQEARLLQGAAAVTIVSQSCAEAMDRSYRLGPKLHVVSNGYDPDELSQAEPYQFGHFAIVYTGIFYAPKRVVTPIMAALKKLKESSGDGCSRKWYFHYYGPQQNHVIDEAKRFGVIDRVVVHGVVPRKEALAAVRGAGLAVVITSVFDSLELEDKGIVTAKVFEALGLKTPILLIAPSGSDVEAIVGETQSGQSFGGDNVDGIAEFLREHLLAARCRTKDSESYAWTTISRKLDSILRKVVGKTGT